MRRSVRARRSVILALVGTIGCSPPAVLEPPQKSLEMTILAGSTTDSSWGSIVRADLSGCRIAAIDFYARELRVLDPTGKEWRRLAGPGPGPGELAQPRYVGFTPDGTLMMVDIGHRRVSVYDTSGIVLRSTPLWTSRRSAPRSLGRLAVLSADTMLDYWGAARWGGRSLDRESLRNTKVVDLVDLPLGRVVESFSDAIIPPDPDDLILSGELQNGDIAFDSSHFYVLRAPTAVIEIYRRDNGQFQGSIQLPRYRRVPAWKEEGTTTGAAGVEGTTKFDYEPLATAMEILADGSLLAVVAGPRELDQTGGYPNQILVRTDVAGVLLDAWRLPITGIVDIWGTTGGEFLLQGHAPGDLGGGAGSHLLVSKSAVAPSDGKPCRWMARERGNSGGQELR